MSDHFGLDPAPAMPPRYNLAPTQESLIVTSLSSSARLARWGLRLPPRRKAAAPGLVINARCEDLDRRPLFRQSFSERRCVVPASGFYEWRAIGRTRQPFYFSAPDSPILGLAGLWEPSPEEGLRYVVLTTAANSVVEPVHHRMPVILAPGEYSVWLDPSLGADDSVRRLLGPSPPEELTSWPVGMRVNDAAYDEPACIEPLEGPVDLFMY